MAMSASARRAIMRDDARRRAIREAIADAELMGAPSSDRAAIANAPAHSFANECLVRPIGVVSPRDVRVSERWHPTVSVGTHTIGTATHDDGSPVLTDDGRATVAVTRDGITEYVPVSHFRGTRNHRRTRAVQTLNVPEIVRLGTQSKYRHDYNEQ